MIFWQPASTMLLTASTLCLAGLPRIRQASSKHSLSQHATTRTTDGPTRCQLRRSCRHRLTIPSSRNHTHHTRHDTRTHADRGESQWAVRTGGGPSKVGRAHARGRAYRGRCSSQVLVSRQLQTATYNTHSQRNNKQDKSAACTPVIMRTHRVRQMPQPSSST